MNKRKVFWAILFVFIAAFSIWAVIAQCRNFSMDEFIHTIKHSKLEWIIMAVICMIIYIMFEGLAILSITKSFGHKRTIKNGMVYAAGDIYFSAITPSATGGQPASAFFMIKDGIPGVIVTVSLIVNVIMYNLALLSIGLVTLILFPNIYFSFDFSARVFMVIGYLVLVGLSALFLLFLKKEKLLYKIIEVSMLFLCKIHLMHNFEKRKQKLFKTIDDYKMAKQMIRGKCGMLIKAFILNVLQRLFLIAITMCTFFALGGSVSRFFDMFAIISFTQVGSNSVPIPGSMGVADFLMLNGFMLLTSSKGATNLELLSRSLSFYTCVILCGIGVLIGYIRRRLRRDYK